MNAQTRLNVGLYIHCLTCVTCLSFRHNFLTSVHPPPLLSYSLNCLQTGLTQICEAYHCTTKIYFNRVAHLW